MKNDKEPAVVVKDLYKSFRLPHDQHSGVKQLLIGLFRRKRNKGYEIQHVLKDVSFEIKKGEFFGIVGRNGSGKSTLLKLLAGIYVPDKGLVHVNGSLTPFIELGVGFNPELTGRENIFLNGALLGFSRTEMDAMYDDIVGFAELEKFMDQKLKNYSSGMQVRLAFSIAIRAESDILLIDEVLAVGDSNFQRKCFEYFNTLKNNKKTVIFVSHDNAAVQRYCDRALLLSNGKVVDIGKPSRVLDKYIDSNVKAQESVQSKRGEIVDSKYVEIEHIKVLSHDGSEKNTFKPGEMITIEISSKVKTAFSSPVVRFAAAPSSGGMSVFGGTTKGIIDYGELKRNQKFRTRFTLENIYNDTDFTVHVSIFDQNQRNILARQSDAAKISTMGWNTDLVTQVYPPVDVTR